MNLVIILTICAVAYVGVSGRLRLALVLSAVPITWVLIVGQRRAGVIALVIGLTLLAVMLFWRQRRTFWKLVPVVTVVVIGYTGAFWNSQSSAGFPAQAIKSVVAPESTSERNQSSDYYRVIERLNINETIRSSPVLGIGFGQPFLRPYYLADISVFEFNAYVPHNSFLYIWTKLGFAGFVTLLYLIARTMMQGAARARAAPYGPDAVVALGGVVFVAMFALFLYVDIAWESRNVFLLALSMALCTGHLADEARSRSDDLSTEQNPVSSSA
jgi:O-antigen ligase